MHNSEIYQSFNNNVFDIDIYRAIDNTDFSLDMASVQNSVTDNNDALAVTRIIMAYSQEIEKLDIKDSSDTVILSTVRATHDEV